MFEKVTDLNFAKSFVDIELVKLKVSKDDLKKSVSSIIKKLEPSVAFVDEEDSEAEFLLDCVYYPPEMEDSSDFTGIDITLMAYDVLNEIEKESFSFEFTYPGMLSYEEIVAALEMLITNIFTVYNQGRKK